MDFDVIVIGSGPGGYVAAIRAAQLGLKVACVEKRKTLGGVCLNVGCIPSKCLLEATAAKETDLAKMMENKAGVVKGLVDSIAALFKKNQIAWIEGAAAFVSPHEIEVEGKRYSAKHFILATGSEPIELFAPFDEEVIVSSTGALAFKKVPKVLAVIGGGVIGVELASVYSRLGSQVTVIEMMETICPGMDATVCKTLLQSLKKQGITFELGAKVESIEPSGRVTYAGKTLDADAVLVAVGRRPYTKGLRLESIGITLDKRGQVPIDGQFRTKVPHIYAIGDLIDGPMLAHKASEEGAAVAEIIAGKTPHVNYMAIPSVVYTHPEAASVGMTEAEAKAALPALLIGIAYIRGNARARCSGELEGMVKVIGDQKTGRLLGMHIVSSHASEMIGEGVIAIEAKMTVEDLARASHAHPTLSETIKEAAESALGRATHG